MRLATAWLKCAFIAISCLVAGGVQGGVTLERMATFTGSNGSKPWGALVQCPDGNFYSTASFGGAYGSGTVFKMSQTGTITTLHSFRQSSDGAVPSAALTLGADGYLYGTTRDGPTPYSGSIFRISTNGQFTTLVRFSGVSGATPLNGQLIQGRDAAFYGMTTRGGNGYPYGYGTAFRATANGELTTLLMFNYATGATPNGGLVEARDGNFYGMTSSGGTLGGGTVFRLTQAGVYTPLVAFSYLGTNGLNPYSALLQASDGNFYGTTTQGGESYGDSRSVNGRGFGTVFKLTPNGAFTTLHSFHGTNGSYPNSSLTEASDGELYGTTASGGVYTNELFNSSGYAGYGTVFKISTNGDFSMLVSFDGTNGADPLGSLIQGKDGNFYSTSIMGGQYNLGTVYRLKVSLPPQVACPAPATVECGDPAEMLVRATSPDGDALVVVWHLNGEPVQTNLVAAGAPPIVADVPFSGNLPLGTNLITVMVTDSETNTVSCSTTVAVLDTTPPVIRSVAATPNALWPPNHQMVRVSVTADAEDLCGAASWRIADVKCNEPADGRGDGSTLHDWIITGPQTLDLRAERSSKGGGRIYYIEVEARDEFGNTSAQKVVTVTVPNSRGNRM